MTKLAILAPLLVAGCSAQASPPPVPADPTDMFGAFRCAGDGHHEFTLVDTAAGMSFQDLGPESFRWLPRVERASDSQTHVARDDDERDFLSVELDADGYANTITRDDSGDESRSGYWCKPIG